MTKNDNFDCLFRINWNVAHIVKTDDCIFGLLAAGACDNINNNFFSLRFYA